MASIYDKYPSLKASDPNDENFVESHDGREERLLEHVMKLPNLSSVANSPKSVLDAIDDYANNKEFLINVGPDKAHKIANIIRQEKPRIFVEIGGYIGYSAIAFAQAMKEANSGSVSDLHGLKYIVLELEANFAKIIEQFAALAGLSDIIKVVVGPAAESIKTLSTQHGLDHVDMVLLDHLEDLYIPDLKVLEGTALLKKNSVVLADNVLRPGAPEYRKYVRENPAYDTNAIPGLIIPGEWEDEIDISRKL